MPDICITVPANLVDRVWNAYKTLPGENGQLPPDTLTQQQRLAHIQYWERENFINQVKALEGRMADPALEAIT